MTSENRRDPTLPISHRHEHDRQHDWVPLERFAEVATSAGHPVAADDFMWMGAAMFEDGRVVHSYKHIDTRRYLHLDEQGHAYRYRAMADGGRYQLLAAPVEAISPLCGPGLGR